MRKLTLLTALLPIAVAAVVTLTSARPSEPWESYDEAVYMDMSLDENIETPKLENKEKHYVRQQMRTMASQLARQKYDVALDRHDEVVVVTLPLGSLFNPNDTLLCQRYGKVLDPLLGILKDPGMYKLVYVVHSDNTGSEEYNMALSQKRVNTIYDILLDRVSEDQVIIPFAMGDTDPVDTNSTRKGREANRRVEFYFIPGPEMILDAR